MRRLLPLADESGAAAAEMALIVPLVIVLLFGGLEAGHFVWSQHKVVEAVRDGARFAGRLPITEVCPEGGTMSEASKDEVRLLTRTGQIANPDAISKVPGWTNAQIEVTPNCGAFVDTGIYSQLGGAGPIVTVQASGPYPSLLNGLGIAAFASIDLSAESNAPVIGI